MTVNLIKLCVGIDVVDHLVRAHRARLEAAQAKGEPEILQHVTRNTPRRSQEVLDGGSLYWVIRRVVMVRQRILGLESFKREDGRPACAIILDHQHIRTEPRKFRAFQGWRYYPVDDTPRDLAESLHGGAELPPAMAAELRDLGLI